MLHLQVQIGGKSGGDCGKVKDLKQLSGGERSYTTVAFTLVGGFHYPAGLRSFMQANCKALDFRT